MKRRIYTIHMLVLLPQALLLGLLLLLLGLSLAQGETGVKIGILILLLFSIAGMLVVSMGRKLSVDATGVTVKAPWKKQTFFWEEITSVEAARVRSRAYLTLCAGERFAMIPNSFSGFSDFLEQLQEILPEERFAMEAKQLRDNSPSAAGGTIPFWFGVVALAYIIYVQLVG